MWSSHITECYSALKIKEILIHGTTLLNLEDIMLSEISQSQKDTVWIHLYEVPGIVKFTETERTVLASDWGGRENGELLFNGNAVSV